MTMRVAFFLDNKGISDIDASNIESGNPGFGGTEYQIILISSLLSKRGSGLNVELFLTKPQILPKELRSRCCGSLEMSIVQASNDGFDFFVLKHDVKNIFSNVLRSSKNMRFIVWCHVFACYWELDYYSRNPNVWKVIFVGKETMDLYLDHPIYNKATYIFNCVNTTGCREIVNDNPFNRRANVVTYVGSIVPFKGFHLLAKAWPKVIKELPDAQLYVVGSGTVYNSGQTLGPYKIAEAGYEKLIMGYLTNEDGSLLNGVHFMGRMGEEKKNILFMTKVGVPNPSGITETFCISAVEMQMYGAKIATIEAPGYLDSVVNGILYRNEDDLAKSIIFLLRDSVSDYDSTMRYIDSHFSENVIVREWTQLFKEEDCKDKKILTNKSYRFKWMKNCIRQISKIIPLNKYLPPVERILIFIERNLLNKTTFMDSNLKL